MANMTKQVFMESVVEAMISFMQHSLDAIRSGEWDDPPALDPLVKHPSPMGVLCMPSGQHRARVPQPGPEPEPATKTVSVFAHTLNVRSSPRVAADNWVGQVHNGDVLGVFEESSNGWFRISDPSLPPRWVSGKWVK